MNLMSVARKKITKKKWILVCISFVCILQMISCDEEPPLKAAFFALIEDEGGNYAKELVVTPDGGVKTLTLISNREWEIIYEKTPWIDVSPTSGNGVATISITITPNVTQDEDSIYLSIINNTLLVIDSLKVKRENYLKTYTGSASITSPIDSICTTCTSNNTQGITANSVLGFANGKTTLSFSSVIKLNSSYTMELAFEGNMQTAMENEKNKLVFQGTGTFDFTPLGTIINDPTVTGIKNTIIVAELTGGELSFQAIIDPATNGSITPDVSTVIAFKGSK